MRKAIIPMVMVILVMFASCSFGADVQKLVDERTVMLYPEGQMLGNMVIGARGKIQFIYVDRTLANTVRNDSSAPDWLIWNTRHWGTDPVKGRTLFVISYEANKPWNFRTSDIAIGGKSLEPGDILTDKAFIIEGELPSGTVGILAVAVPSEFASPGKAVVFSYGEESAEWVVPGK
ncbi:MAG: hypothetical protein STSR0007_00160 [Thermovirga sp.]